MQLNGAHTLDQYLSYLCANPSESSFMFNDILIGVTNFFRDRAPWEALASNVIPVLFEKAEDRPSGVEHRVRDRRGSVFGGHLAAREGGEGR